MDIEKMVENTDVGKADKSIRETLPPKEELVTMTQAQLDEMLEKVQASGAQKIQDALSQIEGLKAKYETQEAESYVKRRGVPPTEGLEINQRGPLGPVDHMDLLAQEHSDTLKGKKARFVTKRPEIVSLRRSQGYEPVKDGDGNEVRYMDSVLMAMPQGRYQETVAKPIESRKQLNRSAVVERFKGSATKHGIKTEGKGIQYDEG